MSSASLRGGYTDNSAHGGPQVILMVLRQFWTKTFYFSPKDLHKPCRLSRLPAISRPLGLLIRGSKRRQVERNMLQGVVF
jgi:hypothetical protein